MKRAKLKELKRNTRFVMPKELGDAIVVEMIPEPYNKHHHVFFYLISDDSVCALPADLEVEYYEEDDKENDQS